MSELVLGLDGGGTQVRVRIASRDGVVLGEGLAGACNVAIMPITEAVASAWTAAQAALSAAEGRAGDVQAVCAGVAGTSFTARRLEFEAALRQLFPAARVTVEPDYAIALTGATDGGAGVLVIAGTGSVAYGENRMGITHKAGAYGYLLDDSGSGYGVGRTALAAVLRAGDGSGEETSLSDRIRETLGLTSLAEIAPGVYGGAISRVVIASLARTVAEAAVEDHDAVSLAILMRAGGALAHLARPVCGRLFPDASEPFPVVPVGGLWNAGATLTDVFTRSLRRFAPQAVFGPARHPPVHGAVLRAVRLLS